MENVILLIDAKERYIDTFLAIEARLRENQGDFSSARRKRWNETAASFACAWTSSPPSLLKRRAAVAELSPEFPVSAPPRQKARGAQRERNNLTALFEFTFLPCFPRARIFRRNFRQGEGGGGCAITPEVNVPSQRSLCKFKCDREPRRAITRVKLFHGS